jgi:hypothetical protein
VSEQASEWASLWVSKEEGEQVSEQACEWASIWVSKQVSDWVTKWVQLGKRRTKNQIQAFNFLI